MVGSKSAAPHRPRPFRPSIIGRPAFRPGPRRGFSRHGAAACLIAAGSALSGCIADGPSGSPLALNLSPTATATPSETEAAKAALSTGVKPAASDVKTAAKEARIARESGTISGSAAIDRMIEKHARENGLPPALAYAVVRVESRYNPRAIGGGAMGLSQIKPATARSLGFSGPSSALLNADTNLTYGMKYLKGAWEQGGHDVCKASMKYKGGHRTTRMTSAAVRYCSAVKAHMAEIMRQRSRMPGNVQEPDGSSGGLVETLVAAVAPNEAQAAAEAAKEKSDIRGDARQRARKAEKNATIAAYASNGDATTTPAATLTAVAEKVAVLPARRPEGGKGSMIVMTAAQAEAVEKAASAGTAPADQGDDTAVDERIANAFD